jgi:hypothetical protein
MVLKVEKQPVSVYGDTYLLATLLENLWVPEGYGGDVSAE